MYCIDIIIIIIIAIIIVVVILSFTLNSYRYMCCFIKNKI
jgi:hypothetical protein